MTVTPEHVGESLRKACAKALQRQGDTRSIASLAKEIESHVHNPLDRYPALLLGEYTLAIPYIWAAVKHMHVLVTAMQGSPVHRYVDDLERQWRVLCQFIDISQEPLLQDRLLEPLASSLKEVLLEAASDFQVVSLDTTEYSRPCGSVAAHVPIARVLNCTLESKTPLGTEESLFKYLFNELKETRDRPAVSASILAMLWLVRNTGGGGSLARNEQVLQTAFDQDVILRHLSYAEQIGSASKRSNVVQIASQLR